MELRQIVLNLFVPADEYSAKAIHPTVRALDYPTPGFVANVAFEGLGLFLSRPNMQSIAKFFAQFPDFIIVIPFIQAEILPPLFSRLWSGNRDTFQCSACHFEIIAIGTFDSEADRESAPFH
jgi:hypothetical protein